MGAAPGHSSSVDAARRGWIRAKAENAASAMAVAATPAARVKGFIGTSRKRGKLERPYPKGTALHMIEIIRRPFSAKRSLARSWRQHPPSRGRRGCGRAPHG